MTLVGYAYDILTRTELGSPASLRWLGGGEYRPPVLLPNREAETSPETAARANPAKMLLKG